jgi:SAM-dependent methyltransferase
MAHLQKRGYHGPVSFLTRCERFGWDYHDINPLAEREVAWYRRHARESGGPVLELACGTGRLLRALAEDGHDVTGLDLSKAMLALAREHAAGAPAEVRERIRLVKGDMADFALETRFALVIVADNSFRELETREDLVRCLRCVRGHLRPGGRLLVTERRFDPSLYPGGVREHGWSEPVPHPETGEPVRRKIRVRLDRERMRISGEMTYRIARAGGDEDVVCRFGGPVLLPEQYLPLFAEAGFSARVFVGYEIREDDGREPDLCFVAEVGEGSGPSGAE